MKINLFNKYELILELKPIKIRKKIKFDPCQSFPVEPNITVSISHDGCKTIWYPNGAIERYDLDGHLWYIVYNTGDEVWFTFQAGSTVVQSIKTHDGLEYNYSSLDAPHQS
ncbi:MAG TPA: hypothetical protein VII94_05455 [Candidatus Saccharimonadales bacterium]